MENRNFYIISILILLLIGLFMIPIAGLLIDPAPEPNYLDIPLEELNGYSLRQVYENDLYIDDDLTILNNHTLREVFEVHSYTKPATDINQVGYQFVRNTTPIFTVNGVGTAPNSVNLFSGLNVGNQLYIRYTYISGTYSNFNALGGFTGNYTALGTSFTNVLNSTSSNIQYSYQLNSIANNLIFKLEIIDRTEKGLTNLTVSQMDYFFNLYRDILASAVFGNYINEFGIYANGSYINDMTTFGLENMSLSKHNYYYDLYQYYSSFEN